MGNILTVTGIIETETEEREKEKFHYHKNFCYFMTLGLKLFIEGICDNLSVLFQHFPRPYIIFKDLSSAPFKNEVFLKSHCL